MPQISVDYSPSLDGSFDRRALGLAINRLAVETIAAKPEGCKTIFRRNEPEVVVGESERPEVQVFVQFAIFPGRSPEAKTALTEGVLALLAEHVAPASGERLHLAVDVRDMDREVYRNTAIEG
ncbi:5-carboxymethyl-2-hydroxymuconate Delta-isomerase [Streptomyces sp. BE303]|uniref:5-carboxymethyl-2-hydroxymuconate Delta-isomerase n=1 Tax=Streptomyces sp. BE303 TaxID=3002528 RepID=UPI002E778F9D|nr:isomerase [Streptomyces sp. BE303]MED7950872.1 isomerase [Streptomyces sp. BE303]